MSNHLSSAEVERLSILAEEAGEVVQACMKILRHGWFSTHPSCPNGVDNRTQLMKEIGDFRGAVALLTEAQDVNIGQYQMCALDKLKRVQKYMHHQENMSLAARVLDAHNGHGGS